MTRSKIKPLLLCILILLIELLASNTQYYIMWEKGYIDASEFIRCVLEGNYHGLLHYSVVVALIYIIYLRIVFIKESDYVIVRYIERNKYYRERLKEALYATILFVIIRELLSFLYLCIVAETALVLKYNVIVGFMFQVIAEILCYLSIFLMNEIIKKWLISNKAYIFSVMLFMAQYFYYKCGLPYVWMPIDDMIIVGKIYIQELAVAENMLSVARLGLFVILLYQILILIRQREDYIRFEKR